MDTPQMYSVGPPKASNFSGKVQNSANAASRGSPCPIRPPGHKAIRLLVGRGAGDSAIRPSIAKTGAGRCGPTRQGDGGDPARPQPPAVIGANRARAQEIRLANIGANRVRIGSDQRCRTPPGAALRKVLRAPRFGSRNPAPAGRNPGCSAAGPDGPAGL